MVFELLILLLVLSPLMILFTLVWLFARIFHWRHRYGCRGLFFWYPKRRYYKKYLRGRHC